MTHLKRGANGHLLRNAAGHLARACGTAANCENCTNDYYQYAVTISGVTSNTGCIACPSGSVNVISLANINDTYILTQVPEWPCRWYFEESGNYGSLEQYPDEDDCTGAVGYTDLYDLLFIQLYKTSTTVWFLQLQIKDTVLVHNRFLFQNTNHVVSSNNCEETSIANTIVLACDKLGTGGAATITPA